MIKLHRQERHPERCFWVVFRKAEGAMVIGCGRHLRKVTIHTHHKGTLAANRNKCSSALARLAVIRSGLVCESVVWARCVASPTQQQICSSVQTETHGHLCPTNLVCATTCAVFAVFHFRIADLHEPAAVDPSDDPNAADNEQNRLS